MDRFFQNSVICRLVIALCGVIVLFSCASPLAPKGGPMDQEPPRIFYEIPANYTTNFNAKRIEIAFNEYVVLKDQQKNVIISPPIKPAPRFKIKNRSLIIDFDAKTKLDSATTYTINFGGAIVDNNEGNPLNDYSYVFSTGSHVDSLAMSGQVIDMLSGDTVINALVMLYSAVPDTVWDGYPQLDSTLFLSKVAGVARTDSSGVYLATNLKDMEYKVYAIKDVNGNNAYEAGEESIGILNRTLNPNSLPPFKVWYNPIKRRINASPQVEIKLFSEKPVRRQNLSTSKRNGGRYFEMIYDAPHPVIDSLILDGNLADSLIVKHSIDGDTIKYWLNSDVVPDTLKGRVVFHSTNDIKEDTLISEKIYLGYKKEQARRKNEKKKEEEEKRQPLKVNSNIEKNISPLADIFFNFDAPLIFLDSTRLVLGEEIALEVPEKMTRQQRELFEELKKQPKKYKAKEVILVQDTVDILKWYIKAEFNPALEYKLMVPDSAFVDVNRNYNDTLKVITTTLSLENSATLKLNIKGDSSSMYILELVDKSDNPVFRKPFVRSGPLEVKYIKSGDYKLRVTEDVNGNGKWDSGSLVEARQPENINFLQDEIGRVVFLAFKDNWEMELDVELDTLFKKENKNSGDE